MKTKVSKEQALADALFEKEVILADNTLFEEKLDAFFKGFEDDSGNFSFDHKRQQPSSWESNI